MPECKFCGRVLPTAELRRVRGTVDVYRCKERGSGELGKRSRCMQIEQQLRREQRERASAERRAA